MVVLLPHSEELKDLFLFEEPAGLDWPPGLSGCPFERPPGAPSCRPGAPLGLKTGAAKEPTGEGSGHASPETKDKNLNKETGSKSCKS